MLLNVAPYTPVVRGGAPAVVVRGDAPAVVVRCDAPAVVQL